MKSHAIFTYWWDIMHNLIIGLQFCCNHNLIYVYCQAFNEDGIKLTCHALASLSSRLEREREREDLLVVISLTDATPIILSSLVPIMLFPLRMPLFLS